MIWIKEEIKMCCIAGFNNFLIQLSSERNLHLHHIGNIGLLADILIKVLVIYRSDPNSHTCTLAYRHAFKHEHGVETHTLSLFAHRSLLVEPDRKTLQRFTRRDTDLFSLKSISVPESLGWSPIATSPTHCPLPFPHLLFFLLQLYHSWDDQRVYTGSLKPHRHATV